MIFRYLLRKFDYTIFESFKISPQDQSIFRIIYALSVLVVFGIPNWRQLGYIPDNLFDPPHYSIAYLFNGFPDAFVLQLLGLALGCLFVALLFGFKTRYTSILITILYIIGNSFQYSKDKIDHSDLLLVITPLIMAFSNWGDYYSIDSIRKDKSYRKPVYWPITLLALVIGFAFFTAGVPKLLSGWLEINSHVVKKLLFDYYYTYGYKKYLSSYFIRVQNDFFWEIFDYAAVIFELTFIFTILKPRIFRFYIYITVIFHLFNLMILNIPFVENLAVYALFMDYSKLKKIRVPLKTKIPGFLIYCIFIATIILQFALYTFIKISPIQYITKITGFYYLNPSILLIAFMVATLQIYLYLKKKFIIQ